MSEAADTIRFRAACRDRDAAEPRATAPAAQTVLAPPSGPAARSSADALPTSTSPVVVVSHAPAVRAA